MNLRTSWLVLGVMAACGGGSPGDVDAPLAVGDGPAASDAPVIVDAPAVTIDAPAVTIDAPGTTDAGAPTIVYVVRHAETTGVGSDPPLSAAGQTRAERLATLIHDVGAIYTSQYKRTHDTAVPTATAAAIAIETVRVDGSNAATYGDELATAARAHGGTVLIVGHSNTVPDTVRALSGTTIAPIAESEFDRLYKVTLDGTGAHLEASTY